MIHQKDAHKSFTKLSNANQPATLVLVFTVQNLSTRESMKGFFKGFYVSFYLNSKIHHPFLPLRLALALRAFNLQSTVSTLFVLMTFQTENIITDFQVGFD